MLVSLWNRSFETVNFQKLLTFSDRDENFNEHNLCIRLLACIRHHFDLRSFQHYVFSTDAFSLSLQSSMISIFSSHNMISSALIEKIKQTMHRTKSLDILKDCKKAIALMTFLILPRFLDVFCLYRESLYSPSSRSDCCHKGLIRLHSICLSLCNSTYDRNKYKIYVSKYSTCLCSKKSFIRDTGSRRSSLRYLIEVLIFLYRWNVSVRSNPMRIIISVHMWVCVEH